MAKLSRLYNKDTEKRPDEAAFGHGAAGPSSAGKRKAGPSKMAKSALTLNKDDSSSEFISSKSTFGKGRAGFSRKAASPLTINRDETFSQLGHKNIKNPESHAEKLKSS